MKVTIKNAAIMTDKEYRKFYNDTVKGKRHIRYIIEDIIIYGGIGLMILLFILSSIN